MQKSTVLEIIHKKIMEVGNSEAETSYKAFATKHITDVYDNVLNMTLKKEKAMWDELKSNPTYYETPNQ